MGAEPGSGLREARRARDRGGRQPADGARRHPRHRRERQGGAVREVLRRVQHPLLTFVDVPGFLPGTDQEWGGIIRHGAKLLYAFSEATVPKMTVITRKAYGGAYDVMCSKHIGADVNVAWPTGEIAVMGACGGQHHLPASDRRGGRRTPDAKSSSHLTRSSSTTRWSPPRWAIDDVIDPRETRPYLIKALQMVATKRPERPPRKHGNIPL